MKGITDVELLIPLVAQHQSYVETCCIHSPYALENLIMIDLSEFEKIKMVGMVLGDRNTQLYWACNESVPALVLSYTNYGKVSSAKYNGGRNRKPLRAINES